jgi:small GTP-binding protein
LRKICGNISEQSLPTQFKTPKTLRSSEFWGLMEFDFLFKVILIGAPGVGKTALGLRFVENVFQENHNATIGVEFYVKTIESIINGVPRKIKLQIWDTAGQERHQSMVKTYYRGASIIMFVFAVDDIQTFEKINDVWLKNVKEVCDGTEVRVLIGNKCDRPSEVTRNQVIAFAEEHGMEYIETSAKTGEKVEEMFIRTAVELATQQGVHMINNKKGEDFVHIEGEDSGEGKKESRKCCGGT